MCYINGVRVNLKEFIEFKQQQKDLKHLQYLMSDLPKRGFDYPMCPVIKPSGDGLDWDPVAMEWGFLPSRLKNAEEVKKFRYGGEDPDGRPFEAMTTLNAKGEELLWPDKMYRHAALHNRCLVLSTGFVESRHKYGINKKTKLQAKTPQTFPYQITLPASPMFMMAGIFNTWVDENTKEAKDTFAIVTTSAVGNPLMEMVHNSELRMPVILPDALADRWCDPSLTEAEISELATYQYNAEDMQAVMLPKNFLKAADLQTQIVFPD